MQGVARNAVRALRGIRLCAEGHEEGRLTHLVLGQQRRTLKVCTPPCHAGLCFVAFCAVRLEVGARPIACCSVLCGILCLRAEVTLTGKFDCSYSLHCLCRWTNSQKNGC